MACTHAHTNHTRRGRTASSAPRAPCARALLLTTPQQVLSTNKAVQQLNYHDGDSDDGNDDGTDDTDSNDSDGADGNNGGSKKVRRARTPSLHPAP